MTKAVDSLEPFFVMPMNKVIALVGLLFTCAALSVATSALFDLNHAELLIATQPCSAEAARLADCRADAVVPVDALATIFVVATVALTLGAIGFDMALLALLAAACTTAVATRAATYRPACGAVCAEAHCGYCDALDPSAMRAEVVGALVPATVYLCALAVAAPLWPSHPDAMQSTHV